MLVHYLTTEPGAQTVSAQEKPPQATRPIPVIPLHRIEPAVEADVHRTATPSRRSASPSEGGHPTSVQESPLEIALLNPEASQAGSSPPLLGQSHALDLNIPPAPQNFVPPPSPPPLPENFMLLAHPTNTTTGNRIPSPPPIEQFLESFDASWNLNSHST